MNVRLRSCLHCGGQVLPGAGYGGETQCVQCGRPPTQRVHEEPDTRRAAIIDWAGRKRRQAVAG